MRMTINVPNDLAQAVEARAAAEQQSVENMVESLLRQALLLSNPDFVTSPGSEESAVWERDENGLPVFRGRPDAPATKLTVDELLALDEGALLEDDLRLVGLTP